MGEGWSFGLWVSCACVAWALDETPFTCAESGPRSAIVTEDDDLDCQIRGIVTFQLQEFEHSEEGEVEDGQSHHPPSPVRNHRRNSLLEDIRMTFSAPTGQERV